MSALITDDVWTAAEEAMMRICDTHEDDDCACPDDEYTRAILEAAAPLVAGRALREVAEECEAMDWGMGGHTDVWAIRGAWLAERADRIETELEGR